MNITSRDAWGARSPKNIPQTVDPSQRRYLVIHHSGGPVGQSVRAIQDWCMDGRGFNDIDYNLLVRASTGEIYMGRGWNVVGSHAVDFNTNGIGVCVIGNNAPLSDQAKRALAWIRDEANRRCGRMLHVRGHGQLTGTTDCPGSVLRTFITAGMPAPTQPEDSDMEWTDKPWSSASPISAADALQQASRADDALKEVQELRGIVDALRDDIAAIKAAVVGTTPPNG